MRRLREWICGLAGALPAAVLAAPAVDEALLKAALVVRTFDHFAAACQQRGGFKPADASSVKAWERDHGVAQIRTKAQAIDSDTTSNHRMRASYRRPAVCGLTRMSQRCVRNAGIVGAAAARTCSSGVGSPATRRSGTTPAHAGCVTSSIDSSGPPLRIFAEA